MIYLDNSATTFPKPKSVIYAVNEAMQKYCANPGRSGHDLSLKAAEQVFLCRKAVCKLFNVDDESKVVFTSGCTQSLNTVIKGVLKPGDHCIISSLEHNSVLRPLEILKSKNISYSIADVYPEDNDRTVDSFRKCINEKTRLIVCTHASNVFGIRLPVERVCALAHSYGILFCLDAAQSAGVLDINIGEDGFDYVCCAGHKGLYGPMGIGLLIINTDYLPDTLLEGGTGSESQNLNQPDFMPDRFESGTLNIPGICGLKKGIEFVLNKGIKQIFIHEMNLILFLHKMLNSNSRITIYNKPDMFYSAPLIAFSVSNINSEEVAMHLNRRNIAVRAGLHCSPIAHKYIGTIDNGVVRISPSVFTTLNDMKTLVFAINNL